MVILMGLCSLTATDAAASPQEIRIGGLFDLTGGGAIWGRSEKNAFLLACKDFETKNPSFRVTPIIEDTLFSNRQTVTSLQKLISIDKVSYVVGATWENTVPMMSICEQKKVVCVSPSYHGKEYYTRPWRYNFSAWFDDRGYSSTIASDIRAKSMKRITIFAALTPYYDSLVEDLLSRLTDSVVSTERVTLEERDFKSILTRVRPDVDGVVMLLDNAGQIQAFLKQWSELRRDRPPVYSDDLIAYLDPPEDLKRHGFRYFYAHPVLEGAQYQEFLRGYVSAFSEPLLGSSAAVAYDETTLILDCVARQPSPMAVRDCLSATSSYIGASGTIAFNGGQTVRDRTMRISTLYP
jgi:branched-chain amino acid transport system substrate-binding protein